MRVRPAPGLLVRDPAQPRAPLPPEGREVPDTAYWRRRLRRGDVVPCDPERSEDPPDREA